jgi:hypothetical protein
MVFEAILDEVDQLHNVSTRLEGLAEQHPPVSGALITIAGNVRNTATFLEVLVATKGPNRFESDRKFALTDRWSLERLLRTGTFACYQRLGLVVD